jgi:hypothetical protein
MISSLWVKNVMRLCAVILLCLAWLPASSPAGAMQLAAGALDKPPLPGNSSSPAKPSVAGDELWGSQFELGADDWVYTAVFAPNGDLYVGGDFHHIGGVSANYVAYWNASTNRWSALGRGVNNRVSALAFSGNTLYVGGYFNQAGGASANAIASYNVNTHTWSNMGGGMVHAITGPDVYALATDGSGNVYAGGQFDSAGGVSAQNIAKWNGSSWSALGSGVGTTNDSVEALAVSGSDVYAGGHFASPALFIAHFDGSTWTGVGGGANNDVLALAISGSNLYVGGSFDTVGGIFPYNYIALWNIGASSWSALGSGIDGPDADAIAVDGSGNVYVAGRFTHAGGNPASRIAMWNGSTWSSLINPSGYYDGVDSNAYGLAIHGSDMIITGGFSYAGGHSAPHLARWNISDQQWYSPANTVNGLVYAVAASGSDVYVGGDFTSAGGLAARSIARWDSITNQWYTVGTASLNGCSGLFCTGPVVEAITINGPDVYVGGNFTAIGIMTVNNVAYFNGSNWGEMGGGVTGCDGIGCAAYVFALTVDGAGVDVGGLFINAGAVTANNIASWSGVGGTWHAFTDSGNTTTGTDGIVFAIANDGFGDYYIGGHFASPSANLVYFDGFDWYAGWTAPNDAVRAIVLQGSDVYIGGQFTNAAGSGADNIAVSKAGSNWQPLGSSLNNSVLRMALRGNTIFVGGNFTQSGALGLSYIAAWDTVGQTWSNLGSGTDNFVNGLAVTPSFVYTGGGFSTAGGKPSQFLGCWGAYNTLKLPLVMK